MAEDPASYLRGVMETNLALAGRAAAQAELSGVEKGGRQISQIGHGLSPFP